MSSPLILRPEPAPSKTAEEFKQNVHHWTRDAEKAIRGLTNPSAIPILDKGTGKIVYLTVTNGALAITS